MSATTSENAGAEQRPPRTDELLSTIADKVGARVAASAVFGAPVTHDGVTVIPVATARFGLGAGGGSDPGKGQHGEGAGAGGGTTPAGYIELKGGRTRFVPVIHPERMVALLCGTALAALLIVSRLGALTRRGPWRR